MNYIIVKVKKEKPTDLCIYMYGIDGLMSDKEYQDGKKKNFEYEITFSLTHLP